MTATVASTAIQDVEQSTPYVLVSTDGHVGPSLTGQLREYCPTALLEDFDAYAAANAGPVAFVGAKEMFDKGKTPRRWQRRVNWRSSARVSRIRTPGSRTWILTGSRPR